MRVQSLFLMLLLTTSFHANAQQQQPADTVIVPLGESSKIIFTIEDRKDIEILRHYNFQELFEDIFDKLQTSEGDSSAIVTDETTEDYHINEEKQDDDLALTSDDENYDEEAEDEKWLKSRRGKVGQTWQSYNVDLGTNNYLQNDQFPNGSEPYAVRPWGSWYLAGNSVQRTKLGTNLFVEWSLGVSWYNFKFQEHNTLVQKDETGVQFIADTRDVEFIKSKLSATFINASLVPVLDFGEHSHKPRIWENHSDGFRFGIGPYVGYRIGSKSKIVYKEGDDREKEKNRDNFYLNNLRYGFRLQIGVRSTDLFVNYDMNELFAEGKGPELNAISFGLIF
jgi:hypothetical protein